MSSSEAPVGHHPSHQQTFDELLSKLESKAREGLPEFMVPTYWVKLEEVPLTPTGKLDRRKLKTIGRQHIQHSLDASQDQRPALTTAQARLAEMWQQVLRLPAHAIGPDSDFFGLGGNSFRAMELVSLSRRHGLALSVGDVLKRPRLSDLAPAVELASPEQGQQSEIGAFALIDEDQMAGLLSYLEDTFRYDEGMLEDVLPCTPLQQGLLASPSSMYVSQFTISVPPGADEGNDIRAAWEMTVEETPILRTRMLATPWGLVQAVFRGRLAWSTSTDDLLSILKAEREVAAFGTNTPLARSCLATDPGTGQRHLVLTLHHAVFDGWSLSAIVSALRSHVDGTGSRIPPGGVAGFNTFVDHIQRLRDDDDAAKSYWTEQLAGVPASSFLTGPSKHQPVDSASHNVTIQGISGNQSLTILARAAWAVLLAEYGGTDDVVFGNTLHGRNSLPAAMQHVVGPTLATLPIRVNLHGIRTVSHLLESLKDQQDAMIPVEQYGLLRIRDIDGETRTAASFQSLLIVQAEAAAAEPGSYFELAEVTRNLHEYALVLTLTPSAAASAIDVSCTFDELVVSPQQVQRIARQLEHLMRQLCTLPEPTLLTDLDMLSPADAAYIFAWNARRPEVSHECALTVIRRQMEKSPSASAVEAWDGQLDYATLDRLSDTLATKLLVREDVTPGAFIGLCFEKSCWAPVSMLAVMKAGCVFVPLSPQAPRLRLEAVARETGAAIILCSAQLEDMLADGPWTTIVVDEGRQVPEDDANSGPPPPVPHPHATEPDSLLYALHTSGTTGTPKTFAISNRSFVTGALARAPLIRRGPGSRVHQFSPFSFDPSLEDVLTTLMCGGCICLPSQDELLNDLSGFMRRSRVNFANITPSVAHTLETDLPDLEYLLLSGEAPNETLIDRWRGRVQLVNGYGPSECSVKCCLNCDLQAADARNIGRAIGSASLWAVRPGNHHQLSPLGAVAELIIESPTLAQGYMNSPLETAKRFVESPQWLRGFRGGDGSAPAVVYKTGDMVRLNVDGTISFVKRADSELRLRGQRFEAEEVVQHIQRYFSGRQYYTYVDLSTTAAAAADEKGASAAGSTVLVAYIAQQRTFSTGKIELDVAFQDYLARERPNIKQHLAASLPGFMIPSVLVGISAVPVTINGKVNRPTLANLFAREAPSILRSAASKSGGPSPPLSETAELLRRLWKQSPGL